MFFPLDKQNERLIFDPVYDTHDSFAHDGTQAGQVKAREMADAKYAPRFDAVMAKAKKNGITINDDFWTIGEPRWGVDSADFMAREDDLAWKFVPATKGGRYDKIMDDLKRHVGDEAMDDPNLSMAERLAMDLENLQAKEYSDGEAEKAKAEHLESVKETLSHLAEVRASILFEPDLDHAILRTIKQAKVQTETPGGCPNEKRRLMAKLDRQLTDLYEKRNEVFNAKSAELQAAMKQHEADKEQLGALREPDPAPTQQVEAPGTELWNFTMPSGEVVTAASPPKGAIAVSQNPVGTAPAATEGGSDA
jgi:hypothetical protein